MAEGTKEQKSTIIILSIAAVIGFGGAGYMVYRNYSVMKDYKAVIASNPNLVWPAGVSKPA